jgi:hypothetical protein
LTTTRWIAVRRSEDGYEWIDLSSASPTPELAKAETARVNELIPGWGRANPVVRVVEFNIVEGV